MVESPFSLCVVGCGAYAADFAANLRAADAPVRLYFASRDLSRARAYSQRFGGSGYFGDYLEAAGSSAIDALYICTPHHLHRDHCELGLANGKHILVEKPITHDMESGLGLVASARTAGLTLMVAENVRFLAQIRLCKRLLEEGAVGSVRLVQFQEEYPFAPGGWRSMADHNGGGVLIDGGIHKVHALRYLVGEPGSVNAYELPKAMARHEGEDGIVVMLRWESGAVGMINHSWTAAAPRPPALSVAGSRGRISLQVGDGQLHLETGDESRTFGLPPDHRGIGEMVKEFKASIAEGRSPETGGEEGLRDINLVFAACESARQGREVPVAVPTAPN